MAPDPEEPEGWSGRKRGGYSEDAVERIYDVFQAEESAGVPTGEARDDAVEAARAEGLDVPPDNVGPDVRDHPQPRRKDTA